MDFQKRLKYYREKRGYSSAKEFAKKIGIPYSSYMAYENKNREPKYDILIKIANTLNVTIDELLNNTQTKISDAYNLFVNNGFSLNFITGNNLIEELKNQSLYVTAKKEGKMTFKFSSNELSISLDDILNSLDKPIICVIDKKNETDFEYGISISNFLVLYEYIKKSDRFKKIMEKILALKTLEFCNDLYDDDELKKYITNILENPKAKSILLEKFKKDIKNKNNLTNEDIANIIINSLNSN